jgi:hypothetical protein
VDVDERGGGGRLGSGAGAAENDRGAPATRIPAVDLPPLSAYRAQIERALKHSGGTHVFEDVEVMVDEGSAIFWPLSPESVVITEIVQHPRKRVLHIFLAAGKMEDIERAAPAILAYGKHRGCEAASLVGRRGWLRSFLTRSGWTDTRWATLTKRL